MASFSVLIFSVLTLISFVHLLPQQIKYKSDIRCDPLECKSPNCTCFSVYPPNNLKISEVPQFVMLTFDDAITVANIQTYRKISRDRKNKGNRCSIGLTFFVCHEYNDYQLTNELYRKGHEIAVHSITHESNTDMWKSSTEKRWQNEMVGMRQILSKFGKIPNDTIVGHRAPFLQTNGDVTYKMLKANQFLYDSSLPTLQYMDPPLWPYTLDYGYSQDCQIQPCPSLSYPGLWVVPMIQYKRVSKEKSTGKSITFHCSMADACTPYPETVEDTENYLMENFNRHYLKNKAPFPLFIHEAWLRSEHRLQGYLNFLDKLLEKEDVFITTIQEVVKYMQNPVSASEYKEKECFADSRPESQTCQAAASCELSFSDKGKRFMKSCDNCPKQYPWLDNPMGL